jgi:nitrogen fixation/metabolism regulation signal transduction histidine kinase
MSLRAKFILYLALIHLVFALSAIIVLRDSRVWLLALEGFFLISFGIGAVLIKAMFAPLDLIVSGTKLIEDGDFTTTFSKVGQPEMDRLIVLYNAMIERLRNERVSQEERQFFLHTLVTAIPSGIIILDYDGKIAQMNPGAERLLEAPLSELRGKSPRELGVPFGESLSRLVPESSVVIPFRGNRRLRGGMSSFIDRGFHRNFILIEELTEEIRHSEKSAYEKLIRMLSHEVNNSVGAVSSLLTSCLHYTGQIGEDDRADAENALHLSIRRLAGLNEFMRGYADIVRIPDPTVREQDIIQTALSCAELFRTECTQKEITWIWEIPEYYPLVRIDRIQMEQVFVNVFKNALEAIGARGTITVRFRPRNGGYSLVVEDTGKGLPDEVRMNLFTPFFTTKENGRGIGLTVVREILTRHGFEFGLESSPGGPTQFSIVFPEKSVWRQ